MEKRLVHHLVTTLIAKNEFTNARQMFVEFTQILFNVQLIVTGKRLKSTASLASEEPLCTDEEKRDYYIQRTRGGGLAPSKYT